ncbi:hypothetical protein BCR43DRAFT_498528 [Syncephalastrum racemosum]|uniref:Uncharacterized protein n=1 Tax=Syncephalastrum racemosum TaxID=13706 RepID=A0A1X2H115_SYNRA|nr:hypothetical protein BCR43DRAFT_498528 [Syncephalastrum racemosum]
MGAIETIAWIGESGTVAEGIMGAHRGRTFEAGVTPGRRGSKCIVPEMMAIGGYHERGAPGGLACCSRTGTLLFPTLRCRDVAILGDARGACAGRGTLLPARSNLLEQPAAPLGLVLIALRVRRCSDVGCCCQRRRGDSSRRGRLWELDGISFRPADLEDGCMQVRKRRITHSQRSVDRRSGLHGRVERELGRRPTCLVVLLRGHRRVQAQVAVELMIPVALSFPGSRISLFIGPLLHWLHRRVFVVWRVVMRRFGLLILMDRRRSSQGRCC